MTYTRLLIMTQVREALTLSFKTPQFHCIQSITNYQLFLTCETPFMLIVYLPLHPFFVCPGPSQLSSASVHLASTKHGDKGSA